MSKMVRAGLVVWAFDIQDSEGRPAELEIHVADGAVRFSAPREWTASPEVTDQIAAAADEAEALAREQRGS